MVFISPSWLIGFRGIFSTKITFWDSEKALKRDFSSDVTLNTSASNKKKPNEKNNSRPPAPTPKFSESGCHPQTHRKKSSCRWHTHTPIFFLQQKLLCHGERLYICIILYPVSPPNQKKKCPKFLARVFSVTKPKPSAPGFPAGRGFRQKPWRHVRIWMRPTRAQS